MISEASSADRIRRALGAAAAVLVLAGLAASLLWWTRHSPYRGRLAAESPGVEVIRDGRSAHLRMLEVTEVRAGDIVRVSPEGKAVLGWTSGATAVLPGGAEVEVGPGAAEVILRAGRVRLRPAEDAPVAVLRGGSRYLVRGGELEATPEAVQALGSEVEIVAPGGAVVRVPPGRSQPWPPG